MGYDVPICLPFTIGSILMTLAVKNPHLLYACCGEQGEWEDNVYRVFILLVVSMRFIGGEHGPGRHTPSGDAGGQVPPSSVMEAHAPPEGGRG